MLIVLITCQNILYVDTPLHFPPGYKVNVVWGKVTETVLVFPVFFLFLFSPPVDKFHFHPLFLPFFPLCSGIPASMNQ